MLKFCLTTLVYVQLAFGSASTNPVNEQYGRALEHSAKIIHGYPIDIRRVPYQVSIGNYYPRSNYYLSRCGGIIISEKWVLSAAHCLFSWRGKYTGMDTIAAGRASVSDTTHSIHHIVAAVYATARNSSDRGDLVLIRVDVPFKFDEYRRPIRLFEQNEEIVPGTFATATGWGKDHYGQVQTNLLFARFPILSMEDCNQIHDSYRAARMKTDEICGGRRWASVCYGDSGGPLTINGRLAGVVSNGNVACHDIIPARFMAISRYRDWIRMVTGV